MADARRQTAFAEKPLPHLRRIELLPEHLQAPPGGRWPVSSASYTVPMPPRPSNPSSR